MSSQAGKIIKYINKKMINQLPPGAAYVAFPSSYNIPYAEAITLIDVYHDIVSERNFDLPTDNDKARAITKEMRNILGISDSDKRRLWPMAVVSELKKINTDIGPELYEWIFPKRIKKIEDTSFNWLPDLSQKSGGGIVEGLSNIKWIAFAGLATLILLQTGILKKAIK